MILKRLALLFIVALGTFSSSPALSQNLFQRSYNLTFNDEVTGLCALPNGNQAWSGAVEGDAPGQRHSWVSQLKPDGTVVWSKTYEFSEPSRATAIETASDGNMIVVFNVYGASTNDVGSGWMKINNNGDVLWAKKALSNSTLSNIVALPSGGYALCGHHFAPSTNEITGLVVRIDELGDIQWSSVFGENGNSKVTDCWEDAQGFIYCSGNTAQAAGDTNGFWAKLGGNGQLVSPVRRFGSAQSEELSRIVPLGSDRLLMSGYSSGFSNSFYTSVWTVETDYFGDLKRSFLFSFPETDLVTNDLIATPGDQFVFALGTLPHPITPAVLMKLDAGLNQLFAFQYKGGQESDLFTQVLKTGNGFSIAGNTKANGDGNAYLVQTDALGQLNDNECCPLHLDITRTEVFPVTASFVPTQTAFYAAQMVTPSVSDVAPVSRDLCEPIQLEFMLSEDTICPGECIEITQQDSTDGVIYSFIVEGGTVDPQNPLKYCHTEGSSLKITRKGTNHNCEKTHTKVVGLGSKKDQFPNAFTPNGDGSNDVFKPVFGCSALTMKFAIYSRWGEKVFETTDPNGGWDGRFKNENAASDVYVWKIEYEVEINGSVEKLTEKGEVSLLR